MIHAATSDWLHPDMSAINILIGQTDHLNLRGMMGRDTSADPLVQKSSQEYIEMNELSLWPLGGGGGVPGQERRAHMQTAADTKSLDSP